MRRTGLAFALLFATSVASAQPVLVIDAGTDAAAGPAAEPVKPGPRWPTAPEPSSTSTAPRPDPGPGLRERSSHSRRSNPASGALLIFVIVGAIGWYVVKKIRRY